MLYPVAYTQLWENFYQEFQNKNYTEEELCEFVNCEVYNKELFPDLNYIERRSELCDFLVMMSKAEPYELSDGEVVYLRKCNPKSINTSYLNICEAMIELKNLRVGYCEIDSNFSKVMSEIGSIVSNVTSPIGKDE